MPCRTYEPFEVVGLIFHQPELVEACSEEALLQALKGLLQVLSITRNKVYSCPCSGRVPAHTGSILQAIDTFLESHLMCVPSPAAWF